RVGANLRSDFLGDATHFVEVFAGHAELARSMITPIALGEQLYSVDSFRQFITAGAVHFVQPDATRLGGITPCWQVAELAAAHRLPLTPHAGDMMQIHLNIAIAHSGCQLMEYIPWLRDCFEEPVTVEGGDYKIPQNPGAGTTFKADVLERFAVE
ncbi:MAG: mandelate racemase/muconate lactonizing enzyme family protein, partial [Planctomycetes bacterium]|nr:mandelate racemase/muconate lactonizing enzyme family protein [Planctomycetota bacterium]